MILTKSSSVQHPEGWHLFKVLSEELTEGKFGTQIKFKLASSVKNEDTGEAIPMTYFTKTVLSSHEKCKLTQLFIACGLVASYDEIEEEEGEWDSALLIGKTFEGRVDAPTTEGGYSNIGAVRPRKIKTQASKRKAETEEVDPFADE